MTGGAPRELGPASTRARSSCDRPAL
jgi:hypothetical protein